MWNIQSDSSGRRRLMDQENREIAWVHGRAMRFHGLASEQQAVEAARVAWQVLQSALSPVPGGVRHQPRLHRLRFVHDGAYEWISDGHFPVARLYRPGDRGASPGNYAIELLVPAYAPEELALEAARAIASVITSPAAVNAPPTLPAA